ncbi:hypothetical protein [Pseudoalteromonas luteoviolacea]|uniref:hypothetical protein n=1 Tax=Pseudoalteromonas luteoviolacea TaxID=43657 RepID=UPI0007B0B141|nr:hypothetical protein [Pseudoalteromonas luteoviolacea]KZN53268.1 hypothetical protein N474_21395 [Pseudoalteromonas luteoviolacea CPMOR-2]TQF67922.1 hypothetical protein FLM44_22350 [Pseudoalteromonas luteoviolacea]
MKGTILKFGTNVTIITAIFVSGFVVGAENKTVSEEIEYLTRNDPLAAISRYEEVAQTLLKQNNPDTILIYKNVLIAASNTQNIPLVEEMSKQLSSLRLAAYINPYLFSSVNAIGVSYRKNGQFEDAVTTYKCALKYAFNDIDKMIVKVNLSIAYRMMEQPAVSFQLLQSIDEAILDGNRKAGLLVVKGNTAVVLNKSSEAVDYYAQARKYYLKVEHNLSAARVTVNLLGAALISRKLDVFTKYRMTLNQFPENQLPPGEKQYLQWLDLMYKSVAKNNISLDTERYIKEQVPVLIEFGYKEHIVKLLQSLDAQSLVPEGGKRFLPTTKLKPGLASQWCQNF